MNLNVRVITPDKVVWDAMVEELILPSSTGQLYHGEFDPVSYVLGKKFKNSKSIKAQDERWRYA